MFGKSSSFKNSEDLVRVLLKMQLVSPDRLNEIRHNLKPHESKDSGVLIQKLGDAHLLTPYQIGQLEKGESDALTLGDYQLLYRNASGSFARVYRARSQSTGEMIGLKLLRQRWADDKKAVALFHREAEVGKRFNHKNIVPIYEVGKQKKYHYFTMEFIEGGNLRDFIRIRKKLSPVEATRCILDMSAGLAYALEMGVTHRDLKMTNVLMNTSGVAKLVDFGLAGVNEGSGGSRNDSVQRALEYAAIEQGTNAPNNDPRSDLFFLGSIYYELLTGVGPFFATRRREERRKLTRYTNFKTLRSMATGIPDCVANIVDKLMQIRPAMRYQTPQSVMEDLHRTLEELGDLQNIPQPSTAMKPRRMNGSGESLPTLMCIESRNRQQNLIREYFRRYGFRVLMFNDIQRGLDRLKSDPPDCVIFMGESIGEDLPDACKKASEYTVVAGFSTITVLSRGQEKQFHAVCSESKKNKVMVEPITLRDLRKVVESSIGPETRER